MTNDQEAVDRPRAVAGLTQRRFSRRQLLRYAGVGAGSCGLAAFLAACGVKGTLPSGGGASGNQLPDAGIGTPAWWDKQKLHHKLNFANWPYYIDVAQGEAPVASSSSPGHDRHQGQLQASRSTTTTPFYAKISPSLQGGQSTPATTSS